VADYFTEVKADHIAFDVARSGGRIKRDDGSHAGGTNAVGIPLGGPGDKEPDDGTVDPFQASADEGSRRELVEVI
jgi:hypothetical protein